MQVMARHIGVRLYEIMVNPIQKSVSDSCFEKYRLITNNNYNSLLLFMQIVRITAVVITQLIIYCKKQEVHADFVSITACMCLENERNVECIV